MFKTLIMQVLACFFEHVWLNLRRNPAELIHIGFSTNFVFHSPFTINLRVNQNFSYTNTKNSFAKFNNNFGFIKDNQVTYSHTGLGSK